MEYQNLGDYDDGLADYPSGGLADFPENSVMENPARVADYEEIEEDTDDAKLRRLSTAERMSTAERSVSVDGDGNRSPRDGETNDDESSKVSYDFEIFIIKLETMHGYFNVSFLSFHF